MRTKSLNEVKSIKINHGFQSNQYSYSSVRPKIAVMSLLDDFVHRFRQVFLKQSRIQQNIMKEAV